MGPEEYGEDYKFPHQLPDGTVVWLFVCRYGQARFFTSSGEQRGPEHESIAAAVEYVVAEGWHEWGGYDKHEREALRESIWAGAKGDSPATGPHRRVTIVDRGTGKQTSVNLASADDRQLMRLAGLTKSAPRMRRNPETTPPMTRDEFIAYIRQHAPADRQLKLSGGALGSDSLYVNYINLPRDTPYDGAESENNRLSFVIGTVRGGWSDERVKIEHMTSALPREYRLRAKSGPPLAIAKYLVAFLAKVAAEVPPKFTHTHRPNQSNAMTHLRRNERADPRDIPHNINGLELRDEPTSNGQRVTVYPGSGGQLDVDWFEVDLGPYQSALAKSNYRQLRDLLVEEHPYGSTDEVVWAKGSGESLIVKYGDLSRREREAIDAMSEYPALDDSDLSREENEQQDEAWDNWAGSEFEQKFIAAITSEVDEATAERVEREGLPSDVDVKPLFHQALQDVQGEWSQESDGGWFIHRFEPAIERSAEIFLGRQPARGSHVQGVVDQLRSAWGMGGALVPNARVQEEGAGDYAVEFTTPMRKHRIRRTTLQAASEAALTAQRQHGVPVDVKNKRKVVMKISKAGKVARPGATPAARRAPKGTMRRNSQAEVEIPHPSKDDRVLRDVDVEGYHLMTWDTGRIGTGEIGKRGKSVLGYAFWAPDGTLLFSGEDYYKAPSHPIDGDETLSDLLAFFLSGTDDESETPAQREFRKREEHGELVMYTLEPEEDDEPMVFRDWKPERVARRSRMRGNGRDYETKGSSQYGASMGRRSSGALYGVVTLERVPLDEGYDPGGAYWGSGEPLYYAEDEEGNNLYFRARHSGAAQRELQEKFESISFKGRDADEVYDEYINKLIEEGHFDEEDEEDEEEGFDEGFIEEIAKRRFEDAHRIDVAFEHGQWFVTVDDDPDEPTKNYSVVRVQDSAGNPRGFENTGIDFEEL